MNIFFINYVISFPISWKISFSQRTSSRSTQYISCVYILCQYKSQSWANSNHRDDPVLSGVQEESVQTKCSCKWNCLFSGDSTIFFNMLYGFVVKDINFLIFCCKNIKKREIMEQIPLLSISKGKFSLNYPEKPLDIIMLEKEIHINKI